VRFSTPLRLLAGVLLVASARSAAAQTYRMQFDSTGHIGAFQQSDLAPDGADVGPSYATILSGPSIPVGQARNITVFCIDIANDALYGQQWDAYFTNLGDVPPLTLDNTRQGALFVDALERYRKAAFLVNQYRFNPAPLQTAGIQGAIWRQFRPSLFPFAPNAAEAEAVDFWMAKADAFAASAEYNTFDYSRFTVITDVNAVGKD
jgi:hypothetical protein